MLCILAAGNNGTNTNGSSDVVPFVFYDLIEGAYDPTGNSRQGRWALPSN
jgi:hypothetical protein